MNGLLSALAVTILAAATLLPSTPGVAASKSVSAGSPCYELDCPKPPLPPQSREPLTVAERNAFAIAVQRCWNVASLPSKAQHIVVTVFLGMNLDATPDASSIRFVSSEGGDDETAVRAFEAARRAILRCGGTGYDLPVEKYSQWREIELVFDPEQMRIR